MSAQKKKKVKTWLKSAVERVREFAYTEPASGDPPPKRRVGERSEADSRGESHIWVS